MSSSRPLRNLELVNVSGPAIELMIDCNKEAEQSGAAFSCLLADQLNPTGCVRVWLLGAKMSRSG